MGLRGRSSDRQKVCRIIEMKIAQKELYGLHCGWNAYHQDLDRIDEMKHFSLRGMNLKKPFAIVIICFKATWSLMYKNVSVQFVLWSLGPFSKSAPKTVQAMAIFHVLCYLWCLYSSDFVISDSNIQLFIIHSRHSLNNIHFWLCFIVFKFVKND